MIEKNDTKVPAERSRLLLLAGLSATAATAGCSKTPKTVEAPPPKVTIQGGGKTFGDQKNPFEEGGAGSDGGSGGPAH